MSDLCEKCGKPFNQMNYKIKHCTKCYNKRYKKVVRIQKRNWILFQIKTFFSLIIIYIKRKNKKAK